MFSKQVNSARPLANRLGLDPLHWTSGPSIKHSSGYPHRSVVDGGLALLWATSLIAAKLAGGDTHEFMEVLSQSTLIAKPAIRGVVGEGGLCPKQCVTDYAHARADQKLRRCDTKGRPELSFELSRRQLCDFRQHGDRQ